jgi:Uncharacterized conserved protein
MNREASHFNAGCCHEKYKDQQVVDFHMSTAYLKEAFEKYGDLLIEPSEEYYKDIATITNVR